MKKIFIYLIAATSACFGLTSCDPETDVEPGGTAVEKLAGEWRVHVDVITIDENGDSTNYGNYYNVNNLRFCTFNTADNTADKIYIYEDGFWHTQIVCNCDLNSKTIFADGSLNILAKPEDNETAKVNGKIIPNGCLNLHGMPNDSICIDVEYSTDPGTVYRFTGSRYTGFYE